MKNVIAIYTTICILILSNTSVLAQEQNVIATAGTYSQTSNGSISWTLGEVYIVTASTPNNDLTFENKEIYMFYL